MIQLGDEFKSLEVEGLTVRILFIAPNGTSALGEVKRPNGKLDYQVFEAKNLNEYWELIA